MNKIKEKLNKKVIGIIALVLLIAVGITLILNFTFSAGQVNTFYNVEPI